MKCLHCESEILDGSQFCTVCGSPTGANGAWGAPVPEPSVTVLPTYTQAVQYGYLKERSIALAVVLSILTCGIYTLYWRYQLAASMNALTGDQSRSAAITLLLEIVTFNIYTVYWGWCAGKNLFEVKRNNGWPYASDNSVLYLVLYLFFPIVADALTQHEINELIAAV